uniref:Putative secreted protein n=1 Tax=Anopheles darlingi TaxID=43151 RepID=A0A2M4DAP5_ANODA
MLLLPLLSALALLLICGSAPRDRTVQIVPSFLLLSAPHPPYQSPVRLFLSTTTRKHLPAVRRRAAIQW